MQITPRQATPEVVVLALDGRLDLVSAQTLRTAVTETLTAGARHVVVDLADVAFLDSSGLGAMVAGLKAVRERGGELRIAAPGEQALTVLGITRLERVLRPFATVDDALAGL